MVLTGVKIGWSLQMKVNSNVQYIAEFFCEMRIMVIYKKDNISAYKA